jgi:hypothetical protein
MCRPLKGGYCLEETGCSIKMSSLRDPSKTSPPSRSGYCPAELRLQPANQQFSFIDHFWRQPIVQV